MRSVTRSLRFKPEAWMKLQYLLQQGDTEVGMFGVAATSDPLLLTSLEVLPQECGVASVEFNPEGLASYMEDMDALGLKPHQYYRVWLHTHPDIGAKPSLVDEQNFDEFFALPDWGVMFILARGGQTSCRLRYNNPTQSDHEIPVAVDWSEWNKEAHTLDLKVLADKWSQEYYENVHQKIFVPTSAKSYRDLSESSEMEAELEADRWALAAEYEDLFAHQENRRGRSRR